MKKEIVLFPFLLLLFSCTTFNNNKTKIIKELNNNKIDFEVNILKTSKLIDLTSKISIHPKLNFKYFSVMPTFYIETDKVFKEGGNLEFELPINQNQMDFLYKGDLNQIKFCYFNFNSGAWEIINTHYDSDLNKLKASIENLKKENIDSSLSKILVSLSFPSKEGFISDLYQENKLVESEQGNLKDFLTENSNEKNCIIIHGVASNPKYMYELFKTIRNLNYYKNIIFYQYASGDNIKNNAEWLESTIKKINPDVHFDIVAHSMGGLLSRFAIEQLDMHNNVNKLMMIGIPNNGVNFAEFAPVLFPKATEVLIKTFPGVSDLITGSKFFQINKNFDKDKIRTKYYVIAGDIAGNNLVKTDLCVSVASATFLYIEKDLGLEKSLVQGTEIATMPNWKYFKKSNNENNFNLAYEHSNLHLQSSSNGVGEQIAEWLKKGE